MVSERILVLDDESSIVEMIEQHLSDEGYECVATTSPTDALAMLAEQDFSLLITDLKMPEMHGMEVLQRARVINDTLAVIVVTALLDITNAIDAIRKGADDYILKPFNLSEISLGVEQALDKRRLVLENRQYQKDLEKRVAEATSTLAETNRELLNTKEYLEDLLNSSVDAVITVDPVGKISYINDGGLTMLGYERSQFIGQEVYRFFAGGRQEVRHIRRMLDEHHRLQNYETEIRREDGGFTPINMSLSQVKGASGDVIATLAICKDITAQKRLEQELKEMSIKDSLTGLYNQRYFYDRLDAEIERARRQGHPLSLLLFDIDQFKYYNDCHGHLEGDRVLQTAGEVVQMCTREHVDLGFRYGGDEFTVILPEADEEEALKIAERIRTTFEAKRFDHLTVSIGLMSYKQGSSPKSFIRFTDAMMYDAKRSGGNRVYVYNPEKEGVLQEDAAAEGRA